MQQALIGEGLVMRQVVARISTGLTQLNPKSGYKDTNPIMMGSMFTVCLVEDIDVFQSKIFSDDFQPSSDRDRFLNIEIQYEGWVALLFGALGASLENYRDWVAKWGTGETIDMFLVPRYPLLSRLNDHLVDVSFTRAEVKALQQEALRACFKSSIRLVERASDESLQCE